MSEKNCINEMYKYEAARSGFVKFNRGTVERFRADIDEAILVAEVEARPDLKAHMEIPEYLRTQALSSANRRTLARSRTAAFPTAQPVTEAHIAEARSYVAELLQQDVSHVSVVLAPTHVMRSSSLGTVYSNQATEHVVVVPESSFDPMGILIQHFAAAAHYCALRERGDLAGMVTDDVTQQMIGHFALLRWPGVSEDYSVLFELRDMVQWEVAAALGRSPTNTLAFVASELGGSMVNDYGPDLFKSMVTNLYESATDGQMFVLGTKLFIGRVLALAFLDDLDGIRRFMRLDTGDRTLADKLNEAMPGAVDGKVAVMNDVLGELLSKAEEMRVFQFQ